MPFPPELDRDLPTCERETFVHAFQLADAALYGRAPTGVISPPPGKLVMIPTGGAPPAFMLTAGSTHRMMEAIKHVGGVARTASIYGIRIISIHDLARAGVLKPFMRKSPDGAIEINAAVLHVAAEAPCHGRRGFDPEDFTRRVRKMIANPAGSGHQSGTKFGPE